MNTAGLRLYHWPICTAFWFIITCIISYTISVENKHVYYLFPYISSTGSHRPESCYFGQLLNIGALLMFVTQYLRFRVVQLIKHKSHAKLIHNWNKWSNIFGCSSCLGMSIVANFQESAIVSIHIFGAFLAFVFGAIYCSIHAYLTILSYSSTFLKCYRTILCFLFVPVYIGGTVAGAISMDKFKGRDINQWNENDPEYGLHLVATFTEWIIAIILILYIASFYVEFKRVKFAEISFALKT